MDFLKLKPGTLSARNIHQLMDKPQNIELEDSCWNQIKASNSIVSKVIKSSKNVYGINTGFGFLAHESIGLEDLKKLQHKLLLSHAAGTGPLLNDDIVRLVLLFKINSLAQGYSGVRPIVIEMLLKFYNACIYPCIPEKGSVGASGDLAPLSHMALPLIGEGQARYNGQIISGQDALNILGCNPLELAAKEGLALVNGTHVSTAIAFYHLHHARNLLKLSVVSGAMSVDAAKGSDKAFHPLIHKARRQDGQIQVASALISLLKNSKIKASHATCNQIQDPYSLRCIPQVLGSCLDNINHVENILTKEANAVTDNPLIFPNEDLILMGGNFHAEPVAQACDILAIAIAEIGAIAERRIALLIDPHFSNGLPPFLVKSPGLNSGFMIAHVTAASCASENKSIAHPASIDSIPTSANQEDHVSMATFSALRLRSLLENVETILVIELLAAAQGIELRKPNQTSSVLNQVLLNIRQNINFWDEDRQFSLDIEILKQKLPSIYEYMSTLTMLKNI